MLNGKRRIENRTLLQVDNVTIATQNELKYLSRSMMVQ